MAKRKPTLASIRQRLKHAPQDWQPRSYIDLGEHLNPVMGHADKGLPYGCICEVSGKPSCGKSVFCGDIAAACQVQDGADIIWLDCEDSFEQPATEDEGYWFQKRGLTCHEGAKNFYLIKPYIGKFGSTERLSCAQDMTKEAESLLEALHNYDPKGKRVLVLDSVANLMPAAMGAAGFDQSMNTEQSLPKFLALLMRRWVPLFRQYNTVGLFVNQLRENPGQMFGDKTYTPGGNAFKFGAHVRVRMRKIMLLPSAKVKGKILGIGGRIRNDKNKAGGLERSECDYKILFRGDSKFLPAGTIKYKK